MKSNRLYILLFAFVFPFFFACESSKSTQNNSEVISKITLEKSTLGSHFVSEITEGSIQTSHTERNGSVRSKSTDLTSKQWKELNLLISKLDLTELDRWEGPTQARFYDGAMATTIIIESGGESFNSQSFDEGEPPAELKELYDYLESLVNQ